MLSGKKKGSLRSDWRKRELKPPIETSLGKGRVVRTNELKIPRLYCAFNA